MGLDTHILRADELLLLDVVDVLMIFLLGDFHYPLVVFDLMRRQRQPFLLDDLVDSVGVQGWVTLPQLVGLTLMVVLKGIVLII
jgi:hypothetical protein